MIALPAVLTGRVGKAGLIAIAVAAVLAIAGFAFWRGMARIDGMVEAARVDATAAERLKWEADIARANAAVEKARADQAVAVAAIEREAAEHAARLEDQLERLERENAALPNGGTCGLGRERVRLLIR